MRARTGVAIAFVSALTFLFSPGAGLWAQTAPPATSPVAAPSQDSTNDLSVAVGKSVVLDLARPVTRIVVGLGDFAEAVAISPNQILVNGKSFKAEGAEASAPKAEKKPAKKAKKPKKSGDHRANPIVYLYNYLKQVVAEMRKVIWPNRKQMVTYTSVVLAFLAFMVALVGLADFGLTKLVLLVFG